MGWTLALLALSGLACDQDRILHGGVGAPCDHGGTIQGVFEPQAPHGFPDDPGCGGDACVFAEDHVIPVDPCLHDRDCNPAGPGAVDRFICEIPNGGGIGACVYSPDYVLERSMCAPSCESDLDCSVIASNSACDDGFSCAMVFHEGPLACQRLCLCNDDLPDDSEAAQMCGA